MKIAKYLKVAPVFACALCLSACGYLFPIDPHKVAQGNIITDKQLSQLHVGMTKADVRKQLGSSALAPVFDDNQWVYIYKQETKQRKHQRLILHFKGNKLQHFRSDG